MWFRNGGNPLYPARCREENRVRQDRTRGGHNTYRPTPELDSRREFGSQRWDSSKTLRLLTSSERTSHTLGTPSHQDNARAVSEPMPYGLGALAHIIGLCIESLSLSALGLGKRVREALLADRFNNILRYKMVYDEALNARRKATASHKTHSRSRGAFFESMKGCARAAECCAGPSVHCREPV